MLFAVMAGAVEHGTQYQMTLAYEHKLQRTAYNFCFGPFGQVKGKFFDHIISVLVWRNQSTRKKPHLSDLVTTNHLKC